MFLIVEFEILKSEILIFCDKRAQCQTRLSNAERSKNQIKFEFAALPRHSSLLIPNS